jgi:hypothetical protein
MTTNTISLADRRKIRELTDTHQELFAEDLIKRLQSFIPNLNKGLNSDLLLDALGCCGLSLHIGTEASATWMSKNLLSGE